MKAIKQLKYGSFDELKLKEVPKPDPAENEILIRVKASSVNFGNMAVVGGKPLISRFWSGLLKPKQQIPGSDVSGVVEKVGKNVTQFYPGDEVYGDLFSYKCGAYAEYALATENLVILKPTNISFEEAAAIPQSGLVALQALFNKGQIQPGYKVLIYGASSGNGTFAVQIAKSFGAEVTAVCSTGNIELVKSLGADYVIDYKKEDFLNYDRKYNLILGMSGYRSIYDYKNALTDEGIYVSVGGDMKQVNEGMMLGPLLSINSKKTLTFLYQRPSQKDLLFMKEMIESGKIKPVVDRTFLLEETAEALKYYSLGHSKGKVIIQVNY